jgi:hypothetical protein
VEDESIADVSGVVDSALGGDAPESAAEVCCASGVAGVLSASLDAVVEGAWLAGIDGSLMLQIVSR